MGALSTNKSTSSPRPHHHPPSSSMGLTIMGLGTFPTSNSSSPSSWLPIIIFLLVALCGEGNSGSQITYIVGTGDMSPPASASALTAASSSRAPHENQASGIVGDGASSSSSGHKSNNNNHANGHQAMMMVMPQGNGKPTIESLGNVTVLAGQRGELKCRVSNLANNTVLWLRHRDTHLLSAGADAYTQDTRFRAFQGPGNTWGLRVSSTRPTDGGVYECQISTTPPISAFTYLTVVEPITRIEGLNGRGFELFIKAGSTINLTCVVEDATDNAPKHILWKHDSRVVNFEWARGGMSLVTEKKSKGVTVSRLLIQKAVRTDSGTYLCAPQNAHPAHVKIVVLEQGEKQAAMQSGTLSTIFSQAPSILPVLLVAIFQVLYSSPEFSSTIISHILRSDRVIIKSNNKIIRRINLLSSTSSSLSVKANSTTCGRLLCKSDIDADRDTTTKTTGKGLLAHKRKGEQITNLL